MNTRTVTVELPESMYSRMQQAAQATQRSVEEILLRALQIGSPPRWDDAPAEFQADLAALDRLADEALWRIAHSRQTETEMHRYQELLDRNAKGGLAVDERDELARLRFEADRLMLLKVHAAALLQWRGHAVPSAEMLRNAE